LVKLQCVISSFKRHHYNSVPDTQ